MTHMPNGQSLPSRPTEPPAPPPVASGRRYPSTLAQIAEQCVNDSNLWFPGSNKLPFLTLAMAGEVGELANIVKKIERGSLDIRDAAVYHSAVMEATDVLIYDMNIFGLLKADPQKAYEMKRAENVRRFGNGRK